MGIAHVRALIGLLIALAVVPASAHEIGTTQVRAQFNRNHTYSIDIVTAPQALLNKLEARARQPRTSQLTAVELTSRLQAFAPQLAGAAEVRFGKLRVTPVVTILPIVVRPDPKEATFADIRLTGEIPPRTSAFTWRYDLAYASYGLTLHNEGHGDPTTQWLDGDERSAPFALTREVVPPTRMDVVRQYLVLGFTHIVPRGLDHILFVLGIFLLSTRLRSVLTQITAFTLAHSITLGLTIYGVLSVSPRIVEPMIAVSIAYVAIENVVTSQLKPWRVAIVFAFGLLHGMGFAGVLKDLGLPRSQFLTALIAFNAGVEAGQLAVIAVAFGSVAWWARKRPWYRYRFVVPASMMIAVTGLVWTVQRILA